MQCRLVATKVTEMMAQSSILGDFGITLGLLWDRFESVRNRFGVSLRSLAGHFGVAVGSV